MARRRDRYSPIFRAAPTRKSDDSIERGHFAGGRGDIESILISSAISSTIAIALNSGYVAMSGYVNGAVFTPGGDAVAKNSSLDWPNENLNNVGRWTPEPGCCWDCEGGLLSRVLNRVPGINAVSGFHDSMLVIMELGGLSQLGVSVVNYPTMLPAAAATYGALLPGVPAEALNHR